MLLFSEYNFFKLNFIDPASPLMYGIIELHDHIFFFLNMILFLVLFLLFTTLKFFTYEKNTAVNRFFLTESAKTYFSWLRINHGTKIEIIWTVVPSIILILIAIPSFALLYATDELVDPSVTIQVIGHQWYWSYEYNDLVTNTGPVKLDLNTSLSEKVENFVLTAILLEGADPYSFWGTLTFGEDHNLAKSSLNNVVFETYLRSFVDNTGVKARFLDYYYKSITPTWRIVGFVTKFPMFIPYHSWLRECIEWGFTIGVWGKNQVVLGTISFDSYMRQETDLNIGEHRLYETDFPLVLPKFTHIRFMITADDVIHSWSVPALGIKVDAVPGRINHAHTYIKHSGVFLWAM